MSHRVPRVGDVVQLPLPDGRFAYERVLRDAGVAFYSEYSEDPGMPPIGSRDFLFAVGVYADVLRQDDVPVVGTDPLDTNEDGWPPPTVIEDPITGEHRICYRGQMRPALGQEWVGLEEAAIWGKEHLLDRLSTPLASHW